MSKEHSKSSHHHHKDNGDKKPKPSTAKNPFIRVISDWFSKNFSDPAAVSLCLLFIALLFLVEFFGRVLMPILISVVFAYLLNSVVVWLCKRRCPMWVSFTSTYVLFLTLEIVMVVVVFPALVKQLITLINHLPDMFKHGETLLTTLSQKYPSAAASLQIDSLLQSLQSQVAHLGRYLLGFSITGIGGLLQLALYLLLVPIMVFFFLKDDKAITNWFSNFMPRNRRLIDKVWGDLQLKIAAYVRGRVIEILIMSISAGLVFWLLGLQYALLLGAAIGISVIVPYVGAAAATVPVVVVGLMQWGPGGHFLLLMGVYSLLVFFDAYILVPILFSESMDLHPVAILISVIIFGAIWGFWGVFFAIPLATLINTILIAWPRSPGKHKPAT